MYYQFKETCIVYKYMIKFIFIGSVDNGKSTCSGVLLTNMGVFSQHEIEKAHSDSIANKMEKWKWAYLLDTDAKERTKGKTHEYNVINFEYNANNYSLVDTPGHSIFIRNTIEAMDIVAKSNGIGICIFSAIENEFESGFERGIGKEQLVLLRASNIKKLIITINKMDTLDYNTDLVKNKVDRILQFIKPLNFQMVEVCYISAYLNKDVDNLVNTIERLGQGSEEITQVVETYRDCEVKCKIYIYNTGDLVCKGYQCILHMNGVEYEIEIHKIKSKMFIKSKESGIVILKLDRAVDIHRNGRVILRKSENTIGYGIIL
jgi:translation elongation factor EF-1alpha